MYPKPPGHHPGVILSPDRISQALWLVVVILTNDSLTSFHNGLAMLVISMLLHLYIEQHVLELMSENKAE